MIDLIIEGPDLQQYSERVAQLVVQGIATSMNTATQDLAQKTGDAAPSEEGIMADKIRQSAIVDQGPTMTIGRLGKGMHWSAMIAIWQERGIRVPAVAFGQTAAANLKQRLDTLKAQGFRVKGGARAARGIRKLRSMIWDPGHVLDPQRYKGTASGVDKYFTSHKAFSIPPRPFMATTLEDRTEAIVETIADGIRASIQGAA